MDIVYLVKLTEKNEELIYSMRSLKNLKHDKVFIVGDLPNFINPDTVRYIPSDKEASRYITTTNHIKQACLCKDLSDDFILMNDDFFILKPITYTDLNVNRGLFADVVASYYQTHTSMTRYDKFVEQALRDLKKLGFDKPLSFELHCPMIINKANFLSIVDKINTEALHCCKRSVYGNYFIKDSKTIPDVKIVNSSVFVEETINNSAMVSSSRMCFSKIKQFLEKSFCNEQEN